MEFVNEQYRITANVESMPKLEHFDFVLNPENIDTNDCYSARLFRIESYNGDVWTLALLDLICASYEPFAVLADHILTVILFSAIVRIDLTTGELVQYVECDNMGGLNEIHAIDDGYIIWGEGDIFRYDLDLNRIWWFSGRDILVSLKLDRHFWIEDDLIHCRDFEGWHYVLNFDGKLLTDFREVSEESE